jgi:guanylate kinase
LLKKVKINRKLPVILVSELGIDLPPENLFWCFDYFMIKPVREKDILAAAEFLFQEESCFRLPSLRARRPDEPGVNFYIAGPYGAGKSTIARLLSDPEVIGSFRDPMPSLSPYPRYITRKLWPKEKEGVDYYSVKEAAFDELLRRGKGMDWKRVDWREKMEGVREFYPLEGIRVSADIPHPVGRDFLIAPAIKGFQKMAPEDPQGHSIFFGISFETMKKRQLDRPESDRDKRTPKTLEAYKKYISLFDPYFPGKTAPGLSEGTAKYGLMIMNEDGNDPRAQQENELNKMRKIAVRLAWYIKHVREGK